MQGNRHLPTLKHGPEPYVSFCLTHTRVAQPSLQWTACSGCGRDPRSQGSGNHTKTRGKYPHFRIMLYGPTCEPKSSCFFLKRMLLQVSDFFHIGTSPPATQSYSAHQPQPHNGVSNRNPPLHFAFFEVALLHADEARVVALPCRTVRCTVRSFQGET
jgi:hypothetical protein